MSSSVKRKSVHRSSGLLSGVDLAQLTEQAKLDEVSVALCALLEHEKVSRAELARRLGWAPSRVTRVLSGDDNLTLRTLVRLLSELNYDFDVVMRGKSASRARQPWDKSGLVLVFDGSNRDRRLRRGEARDLRRDDYRFISVIERDDSCANDGNAKNHESVAA